MIELMVATAVFIIGMLGVFALQTAVIGNNTLAADWSLASNLASSGLERLRVDDFSDVVGASPCPPLGVRDLPCYFNRQGSPVSNPADAYFVRTWEAIPDSVAQVTDITVKVIWHYSFTGYVVDSGGGVKVGQDERKVQITGRIYPR